MSADVTAPSQVAWRDVLIGDEDQRVLLSGLRGWLDSPDMRSADADRQGRHGQFPGPMLASGRIIEVDFTVSDPDMLEELLDAPQPDENPVEETLTVWFGTSSAQTVQARCTKWSIPTDAQWVAGYRRGTLVFKATDPRRYGVDLHSLSTSLATPSPSGLAFPLKFPLDFGPGVTGGNLTVANVGNAAAWPVLLVDGLTTGPTIIDLDSGRQLAFSADFVISAGQQLVLDADRRTVLLGGASRRNELVVAEWFPIPRRGQVRIGFQAAAYDPASRLTVQWRDASL